MLWWILVFHPLLHVSYLYNCDKVHYKMLFC